MRSSLRRRYGPRGILGDSRFAIAPDGDDDAQLDENPIFEDDEEDQMIV